MTRIYSHYPSKKADKATSPRFRRGEVAVGFQDGLLYIELHQINQATEAQFYTVYAITFDSRSAIFAETSPFHA